MEVIAENVQLDIDSYYRRESKPRKLIVQMMIYVEITIQITIHAIHVIIQTLKDVKVEILITKFDEKSTFTTKQIVIFIKIGIYHEMIIGIGIIHRVLDVIHDRVIIGEKVIGDEKVEKDQNHLKNQRLNLDLRILLSLKATVSNGRTKILKIKKKLIIYGLSVAEETILIQS